MSDRLRKTKNTPAAGELDAIRVHRLDNGVTVLLESLPYLRSVSIGVWIQTGSGYETSAEGGISHFLEHLLFKGTRRRSARRITEEIECRGGNINAFTSRDYTCVYVKTLDEHALNAVDVLADIVADSQLNDFEKERNVIIEEIAAAEDVPEDLVHDLCVRRLWPDHPLGVPVAGTAETVADLEVDQVRSYYERHYGAERMIITAAGSIDEASLFAAIEKGFGSIPGGRSGSPYGTPRIASGMFVDRRPIAQHHVCLAYPGTAVDDSSRYAYDVLSSVLGGGATSRLFERVREDEGLAYAIYTFESSYCSTGMLGVYAAIAPENLRRTMDITFGEIRDLAERPPSVEEVELNREYLKGTYLMALESTSARMGRLAKCMIYHGRIVPTEEVVAELERVTPEAVQRAAARAFKPGNCCFQLLGPDDGPALKDLPL